MSAPGARPLLLGVHYSPWSLRARWMLDHHGIDYDYREHLPMVGEWRLRWLARGQAGPVSVPLLVLPEGQVLLDSWDIACWADWQVESPEASMIPNEQAVAIKEVHDEADAFCEAGRVLVLKATMGSRTALAEQLEGLVPRFARSALAGMSAQGARFLRRKYGVSNDFREAETTMRRILTSWIKQLGLEDASEDPDDRNETPPRWLFEHRRTYADVVVALALGFVQPRKAAKLGPGTRESWTREALLDTAGPLLRWREQVLGPSEDASDPNEPTHSG